MDSIHIGLRIGTDWLFEFPQRLEKNVWTILFSQMFNTCEPKSDFLGT